MKSLLVTILALGSLSTFAEVKLTETFEVKISESQSSMTPNYALHLSTIDSGEEYTIMCDSSGNKSALSKSGNSNEIVTGFFFESERDCLYTINAIKKMNSVLKYEKFGLTVDSVKSKFLEVNARK